MRVGILTFHNAVNCGAVLQAWALSTYLRKMGCDVSFPDCNSVGRATLFRPWVTRRGLRYLIDYVRSVRDRIFSIGVEDLKRIRFSAFKKRHMPIVHISANDFSKNYDLLVVGSDQVWNPEFAEWWFNLFLCENVGERIPKIGYAISTGDGDLSHESKQRCMAAIDRFKFVSFREERLLSYFGSRGKQLYHVVDPTLLLDRADYKEIEYPTRLVSGDYLFAYCVSYNQELGKKLKSVAEKLGVKLILVDAYRPLVNARFETRTKWAVSPDRMLAYVRDATYVISVSFHGTVFALTYGKPFISICGENPENRVRDLLRCVGESKRAVSFDCPEDTCLGLLRMPLRTEDCRRRLMKYRGQSEAFLREGVKVA